MVLPQLVHRYRIEGMMRGRNQGLRGVQGRSWKRRLLLTGAVLASGAAALAGGSGDAIASPALPTILFAVGGGPYSLLPSMSFGSYAVANGETDGISYGLLGSSASESLTEARLIDVSGSLTNTNSTATTVDLVFSSAGFTSPIAPPELYFYNRLGGAIIGTIPVSMSLFSCVGPGAGPAAGDTFSSTCAAPDYQTPTAYADSSSFDLSTMVPVSILSAPYGLYQTLAISMPAGSSVEFSNNATVNTPEPGTVALLGIGVLGLGFACRRRLA